MEKIAKDGKTFGTRWKIGTEGFPSESGYEPDDEADEGSHNEEMSRAVTVSPSPDKTSD